MVMAAVVMMVVPLVVMIVPELIIVVHRPVTVVKEENKCPPLARDGSNGSVVQPGTHTHRHSYSQTHADEYELNDHLK
jgi:hypothetical protein